MPNYTTNLNLEQPLDSEQYDVAVTRRNNQKIDDFAGQVPPRALTADTLTTARNINGVSFKGNADITLPTVNLSGNQTIAGVKTFSETIIGTSDKAIKDQNGDIIDETYIKNTELAEKWHALKSYEDNNEALTDVEGLNDVLSYAYSTFDKSKFNTVGTLVITDDGIASGFSTLNYLHLGVINKFKDANTWEVVSPFFKPNSLDNDRAILRSSTITNDTEERFYIGVNIGHPRCAVSIDGVRTIIDNTSVTFTTTKWYQIKFKFTGTKYQGYWREKGSAWTLFGEEENSNKLGNFTSTFDICHFPGNDYLFNGTIDLRGISIKFDNNLYYSAYKLGIDTIKNDDFLALGSPKISDDGIAVMNAQTDLLYKDGVTIESSDTLKIDLELKNLQTDGDEDVFTIRPSSMGLTTTNGYYDSIWIAITGGQVYIRVYSGSNQLGNLKIGNIDLATSYYNQKLKLEMTFSGTTLSANLYRGTTLYTGTAELLSAYTVNSGRVIIGAANWKTNRNIEYNLNGIRIYKNGALIYQPCLKIPYKISKTDSKVVDVACRDRVQDMYEQYGNAPYYTIDEDNGNFTLPMGEMYGIIENSLDRSFELATDVLGLETGKVSNNKIIYNDVEKYNYSTYDSSKFTVVGNPHITNNGIASGFSTVNYLHLGVINNFKTAKNWEVITPFFKPNSLDNDRAILRSSTIVDNNEERFYIGVKNGHPKCSISISGVSTIIENNNIDFTTTEWYQIKFVFTGTTYEGYSRVKGGEWSLFGSAENSNKLGNFTSNFTICYFPGNDYLFNGEVDLKELSIKFNDQQDFKGTKTGIDIIKANNYTIVGTPTITDDGIISDFTTSDYVYNHNAFTLSSTGEFHIDFNCSSSSHTEDQYIFDAFADDGSRVYVRRVSNTNIYACSISYQGTVIFSETLLDNAKDISGYVEYKDGTYKFYLKGANEQIRMLESDTLLSASSYDMQLGVTENLQGTIYFPMVNGSIDMNKIKVYVDDKLVYQPCLKIPYSLSSTGSKIVDVSSRSRVQDMYEQYGSANYYTIDETHKNFTLPMGEVYGFIRNNLDKNASNGTSEAVNNVFDWISPDYANAINVLTGEAATESTYTCPANGWLKVTGLGGGYTTALEAYVKINNILVCDGSSTASTYATHCNAEFIVNKGDVITYIAESSGYNANASIDFIPLKGV